MRKSVLLVTVILMSLFWGTVLVADDEMCVPLGEITITPLVQEAKRADVAFPHATHFNYSCQECHHKWDKTSAIQSCTTAGCHDLQASPTMEDGKPVKDPKMKIRYFKNAFHENCIGCHKKIKMGNKAMEATKAALGEKLSPTGPTSCGQCHPKE